MSYSHADAATVRWLHRALESYRLPRKLVGQLTPLGPAPRRLTPIFRDRDELPASGDLGSELRAALARSIRLVVVCSPAAACSPWVNEEIITFKRLHGEGGVLALIAAGEPGASAKGREDEECFPPALRRIGPDGRLTDEDAHPIAADLRRQGDGRRAALLKLVAGLSGVRFDDLAQREAQRRLRSLTVLAAASAAGMALTGGLAVYANERRIEAEHETAAAKAAADFLVGTFAIANPATDNPRTITALTILERGAKRAQADLSGQPAIAARLLETMGRAYNNLGLLEEARVTLEGGRATAHKAGADGAGALLALGSTYARLGDLPQASATGAEAEQLLGRDLSQYPEQRGQAAELRGRIAYSNFKFAESDKAYAEAVADYRRAKNLKPQVLVKVNINHATTLAEMGRHDDARAALLQAIQISRAQIGERDALTGQAYLTLAENDAGAGLTAQALEDIGQSVGILTAVLEDGNPILADALSERGQIELNADQPAAARADLVRAIDIFRRAYNGPHAKTGGSLVYLALAESKLDHTAEALKDLDLAKIEYDGSYHHLHVNHGDRLVNRAVVLAHAGRVAEAKQNCAEGLQILGQFLKPDEAFYKSNVAICARI
nr:toll/interleukin-1 receptor domain-containing protein [Phenylobacterium sp.]